MATPLWRMMLVPASFRLAPFHVDANSRSSGRRVVLHEFPKRDTPYAEDMGRRARTFPVTGYVIGPDYQIWRELLVLALEAEGPGLLTLPTWLQRDTILVQPREYTVRETRQAGGMAEFEMQFVEAGEAGFSNSVGSQAQSQTAADNAETQTVDTSNTELNYGAKGIRQRMMTLEREEATKVVVAVILDLIANVSIDPGRLGSMFRLACGDLLADAEQLINDAQVAAPLANVFDLARRAGASVDELDVVRAHTEAIAVTYFAGISVQNTCIRLALVQCARILAATVFTSRPAVDAYIDRMNVAFDGAETIAGNSKDQASYRSLVSLHAAVTFDLTTRERPLPTIIMYEFATARPALWICNRLYGGDERTQELIDENNPVHPAFVQMPVRALSQ